jgi:hypothetical protein
MIRVRDNMGIRGLLTRLYRSKSGLWFPLFDLFVPKHKNVLAVLGTPYGKLIYPAANIVTDAGDIYYAQLAAGESPTNNFNTHELASAGTPDKAADRSDFTMIGSTQLTQAASYPRTNDPDADNTGAGADIRTTLASYTKASFSHAAITHGIVTVATPGASAPLLTGYAFAASFAKTTNDTLKVFVNHEMLGV